MLYKLSCGKGKARGGKEKREGRRGIGKREEEGGKGKEERGGGIYRNDFVLDQRVRFTKLVREV